MARVSMGGEFLSEIMKHSGKTTAALFTERWSQTGGITSAAMEYAQENKLPHVYAAISLKDKRRFREGLVAIQETFFRLEELYELAKPDVKKIIHHWHIALPALLHREELLKLSHTLRWVRDRADGVSRGDITTVFIIDVYSSEQMVDLDFYVGKEVHRLYRDVKLRTDDLEFMGPTEIALVKDIGSVEEKLPRLYNIVEILP